MNRLRRENGKHLKNGVHVLEEPANADRARAWSGEAALHVALANPRPDAINVLRSQERARLKKPRVLPQDPLSRTGKGKKKKKGFKSKASLSNLDGIAKSVERVPLHVLIENLVEKRKRLDDEGFDVMADVKEAARESGQLEKAVKSRRTRVHSHGHDVVGQDSAKQHHPKTKDVKAAGYVLHDGTHLDFRRHSDANYVEHGHVKWNKNKRGERLHWDDMLDNRKKFIHAGAVRMDTNEGLVGHFGKRPTPAQDKAFHAAVKHSKSQKRKPTISASANHPKTGTHGEHYTTLADHGGSSHKMLASIHSYYDKHGAPGQNPYKKGAKTVSAKPYRSKVQEFHLQTKYPLGKAHVVEKARKPLRNRVEVWAFSDGKVLCGKYPDGTFGTYGGGVDDDDFERAARREFREEGGRLLKKLTRVDVDPVVELYRHAPKDEKDRERQATHRGTSTAFYVAQLAGKSTRGKGSDDATKMRGVGMRHPSEVLDAMKSKKAVSKKLSDARAYAINFAVGQWGVAVQKAQRAVVIAKKRAARERPVKVKGAGKRRKLGHLTHHVTGREPVWSNPLHHGNISHWTDENHGRAMDLHSDQGKKHERAAEKLRAGALRTQHLKAAQLHSLAFRFHREYPNQKVTNLRAIRDHTSVMKKREGRYLKKGLRLPKPGDHPSTRKYWRKTTSRIHEAAGEHYGDGKGSYHHYHQRVGGKKPGPEVKTGWGKLTDTQRSAWAEHHGFVTKRGFPGPQMRKSYGKQHVVLVGSKGRIGIEDGCRQPHGGMSPGKRKRVKKMVRAKETENGHSSRKSIPENEYTSFVVREKKLAKGPETA